MNYVDSMSGFSVDDLDRAKQFYGATLGLDVHTNEMSILELKLPGGGKGIIYPKPDHQAATYTVLNLIVSNIEAAVDELTAGGVTFEQYDREQMRTDAKGIVRNEYGPAIAWFKDPAGNIVSLIEAS
jgi:catechol 2,3-dioxygenase-like lactoylglutathione lyase family enzyme